MDAKRHRLSDDVKKITTAAARLKLHGKRKDKVHAGDRQSQQLEKAFTAKETAEQEKPVAAESRTSQRVPPHHRDSDKPRPAPASSKGLPHHIVEATRVPERKWTVGELLQNLGVYVQRHSTHLHTVPSAAEVSMWVRCADRALQLNGWTVNSFLIESHVVFTYMLLSQAFQRFTVSTLADVKEIVLMCLYVSYTYNANEISYPLRPFLVKPDAKVAFWEKCTALSWGASTHMLRLNQDKRYYVEVLASLKRVTS